ncbi:ABC transporter permease [Zobellella taiwanensis]|jgi:arginine/ornithine transport system permease protein|uniref:Arginine ABC transporter permease ArtQ n=1 Tax=Zobellella taiwanensis TaxID=347535 RepID=A0A2P7R342_9GAMM|nr:ABC transporter permease [Zobellella taiwanensis]PSJ44651.1 arginine ABC transporter permease ArtQ [Zobellella taiwanensis]
MLDLKGYEGALMEGAWVTIEVALLSLLLAVALGLLGALAKLSSFKPARWLATGYTTVIRGIPDLVLMMLIFFGGQVLLNNSLYSINQRLNDWIGGGNPDHQWVSYVPDYIEISPFMAGIITIGFIFGAYMTETFRGAILAVDKGELEAARAYGMNPLLVFRRILFPQMMRHALPGLGNNWLVLLKTTALVSIIGLDDMVRKASLAAGATQLPFTFYLAVAIIFLLFTTLSTSMLKWAERHYAIQTR